MIEVPEYLNQYVFKKMQKGNRLSFKIKCTCGCEDFSIVRNSYTKDEKRLKKEYEGKEPVTGWHSIYGGIDANGKPYNYIRKFFFFKKYIEFPPEPEFMRVNVIKATCSQCNNEIVIFDNRYHGYDSQFTTEEQRLYAPHFETIKAQKGNIFVSIEQYDKADVAPELFSWIQISVTDGNKTRKFFEAETG